MSHPPPPSLRVSREERAKTTWVGIDPGFSGSIGVIDEHGRYVMHQDVPLTGGEGRSREIDAMKLAAIVIAILRFCPEPVRVFLEWPQTRPGEAPESSKRFGVGLGLMEGVFAAHGIPVEKVAPNKWKGQLGLSGKEGAELDARRQAVEMAESFIKALPADVLRGERGGLKDGRAEALLIAWWALTRTREGLMNLDPDTRMARVLFGSSSRRRRGII